MTNVIALLTMAVTNNWYPVESGTNTLYFEPCLSQSQTVEMVTVTNEVPRWKQKTMCDGGSSWVMWTDEASEHEWPISYRPEDSTDRVRIVQTQEVTRLTFKWLGKWRELSETNVLSDKRTILTLKEEWVEVGK